jgi:hypothetical protein
MHDAKRSWVGVPASSVHRLHNELNEIYGGQVQILVLCCCCRDVLGPKCHLQVDVFLLSSSPRTIYSQMLMNPDSSDIRLSASTLSVCPLPYTLLPASRPTLYYSKRSSRLYRSDIIKAPITHYFPGLVHALELDSMCLTRQLTELITILLLFTVQLTNTFVLNQACCNVLPKE